jgi:hypothetical protein
LGELIHTWPAWWNEMLHTAASIRTGTAQAKVDVIVQRDWHLDPGDICMVAVEVTRDRFDQHWEGGLAPQATGLPH